MDVTEESGLKVPQTADSENFLGSNGGMIASDFDDDGWPDLYVGVYEAPNHLFLNGEQGHFRDATTGEIDDPGQAYGAASGDIDNDGDLDLFQAAGGGGGAGAYRSLMLQNLGAGQFLDVTEGVGLSALGSDNTLGPNLADIDNDGDLDLLTSNPHFLFLNNGDGIFVDRTSLSGLTHVQSHIATGDYDLDGFLDIATRSTLYRNNRNANHWLRVELAGRESNRSGIGARLIATSGDLLQGQEILGGRGYAQDEMVAHFGLGQRTQVDRLEIRWPSGQVEVLSDIPADQKIRVIEGQDSYHRVQPTTWDRDLPTSVVDGTSLQFNVVVRPALFDATAQITRVRADLSPLGGPVSAPLTREAEGVYALQTTLEVDATSGLKEVRIAIEQETFLGPYRTTLVEKIDVLPATWPDVEKPLFTDAVAGTWQVEDPARLALDSQSRTEVFEGESALELESLVSFSFFSALTPWGATFRLADPVDSGGYRALRFAFHGGNSSLWQFGGVWMYVNQNLVGAVSIHRRISLEKSWQEVEIPLEEFRLQGPIESIHFGGEFEGTFYIDDIRLIPAPPPTPTAVVEERTEAGPQTFALEQNYPNPFNSSTIIRFALPQRTEVELVAYNLAGQRVASLVEGMREAGMHTLHWDGRDNAGQALASGVYLYRLRAGVREETRKLLLVR